MFDFDDLDERDPAVLDAVECCQQHAPTTRLNGNAPLQAPFTSKPWAVASTAPSAVGCAGEVGRGNTNESTDYNSHRETTLEELAAQEALRSQAMLARWPGVPHSAHAGGASLEEMAAQEALRAQAILSSFSGLPQPPQRSQSQGSASISVAVGPRTDTALAQSAAEPSRSSSSMRGDDSTDDFIIVETEEECAEREERAAREAAVEREVAETRTSEWWKHLEERTAGTKPAVRTRGPTEKLRFSCQEQTAAFFEKRNPLRTSAVNFVVKQELVSLRAQPRSSEDVCGGRRKGDFVDGFEETFDGWTHIIGGGWIFRGRDASVLEPRSPWTLSKLLVTKPFDCPGSQMFEVIAKPSVDVRCEPSHDAEILDRRVEGEFLLADRQNYSGWVRLSDDFANVPGWVCGFSIVTGDRQLELVLPES